MKKSSMGPECNPYFRESLEELSWPVMARALRQYLTRVAEDDGAIVRNRTDALEGLLRVLLPHSDETEAVRAALALLVQKGFLSADATSIFVRTEARVPVPGPVKPSTKACADTGSDCDRPGCWRRRQRSAPSLRRATTAESLNHLSRSSCSLSLTRSQPVARNRLARSASAAGSSNAAPAPSAAWGRPHSRISPVHHRTGRGVLRVQDSWSHSQARA